MRSMPTKSKGQTVGVESTENSPRNEAGSCNEVMAASGGDYRTWEAMSVPAPPPARLRVAALALFAALAFAAGYPLSREPGARVSYEGDPLLNTFILAHSAPQLVRAPARLFDAPAFAPYHDSLAFSEHLLFPSLLAWPLRALTGNPLLAHNLLALGFMALSGYFMFCLAQRLTGGVAAGLVAGALYGSHTFLVNELPRLQIQAQCFFPLGLLLLVEHFERPRWGTASRFAVVTLMCGLSNNYYQLYLPLLYVAAMPWLLARCSAGRRRSALLQLALALLPVLAVFAPLALRYLEVADRFGFSRQLPVGIGLEKYLATRPENWLYGETVAGVRLQTQAAHFTGLLPLALAGVALVASRRGKQRGLVRTALAGFVLFVLLSMGRDVTAFGHRLGPGPYRLLYAWVPGFELVRIPERFALPAMFWLALLAALGAQAAFERWPRRRTALAALLTAAVYLEHLSIPVRTIRVPQGDEAPEVYRWLATYRAGRVAELPFYGPWLNRLDSLPMYFATGAPRAIVNGYTGFYPPAYAFLRYRLSSEPGPFALEVLERLGVDHIVVHPHLWEPKLRKPWLAFLAGATDRLRLVHAFAEAPPRYEPAWDHGGELVYRVRNPGSHPEPPMPERTPVAASPRWTARASRGAEPELVLDGDPATEWGTGAISAAGDFLEVRFHEDVEIRGVRLLLSYPHSGYPGTVKVSVRREDGRRRRMRFDREQAERELLARLLRSGREAWFAMDFEPVRANAVRVQVTRGDPWLEEWRVAELQVYR